jgi:hypothetical protein
VYVRERARGGGGRVAGERKKERQEGEERKNGGKIKLREGRMKDEPDSLSRRRNKCRAPAPTRAARSKSSRCGK